MNKEIEYKYNANSIKLSHFKSVCSQKSPIDVIEVSGADFFYKNTEKPETFYRYRFGPNKSELTFKVSKNNDNVTRDEFNIEVKDANINTINAYLKALGYEYSGFIFKNCFIFQFDSYCVVYYICYDQEMQELGRFIEIEMKEDYPWFSVEEAQGLLKMKEMSWKELGIGTLNREKRSLFQMFGGGT